MRCAALLCAARGIRHGLWRARTATSSAQVEDWPAQTEPWTRHEVPPPTALVVRSGGRSLGLNVRHGDPSWLEVLPGSCPGTDWVIELNSAAIKSASSQTSTLRVEAKPVSSPVGTGKVAGAAATPPTLHAAIPSRYCSLDVETSGPVRLAGVQEASLRLRSGGGAASLGRCRVASADVGTGGGAIDGAVVAASARLRTGGGAARLGKLGGGDLELRTEGGDVWVGACYALWATLETGGGDLVVDALRAEVGGKVVLSSGGGRVEVSSLDGDAEIRSEGGDMQIHVQPGAGSVAISSGGGNVTLSLSPEICGKLVFRPPRRVELPADATPEFDESGAVACAQLAPRKEHPRTTNHVLGQDTPSSIVIFADGGKLLVSWASWLDSLQGRLNRRKMPQ